MEKASLLHLPWGPVASTCSVTVDLGSSGSKLYCDLSLLQSLTGRQEFFPRLTLTCGNTVHKLKNAPFPPCFLIVGRWGNVWLWFCFLEIGSR